MNLIKLTNRYVDLFNAKDITSLERMLDEDTILIDPENIFFGKEEVHAELARLLSHDKIVLEATNIYRDLEKQTSFLEFKIQIDDLTLKGVDIIKWSDGKICRLSAYVNEDVS